MTATERAAVLVIDDDPDFRELVRILVENEGVDVLEAPDCVAGAALLREARERVALVLLDYWMPKMEPAPCAGAIASLVLPTTRVILVTAAVDAGRRAAELGLSTCLQKPFDNEELARLVRQARATFRA